MSVLNKVAEKVQARVNERKKRQELDFEAVQPNSQKRFEKLFATGGQFVVAEIKFKSPSEGVLTEKRDPVAVAAQYARAGAGAVSILTEEDFFDGSRDYLAAVRNAFPDLPILMKDFMVDEYQFFEAAILGADAVLLIAALLGKEKLKNFFNLATRLGLTPLIEVHDEHEMAMAAELGATFIGVNNRDLKTLKVNLQTSRDLAVKAPKKAILVAESGLSRPSQLEELAKLGFRGFLVGTSFMKTSSPGAALARLLTRVSVKVCGLTRREDAARAFENGASALGFVFYPKSPRYVKPSDVKNMVAPDVMNVGVFVNETAENIIAAVNVSGINAVQLHGDESPDFAAALKEKLPGLKIIKALRAQSAEDFSKAPAYREICDFILIDGLESGKTTDWAGFNRLEMRDKAILAGGLSPANIGAALEKAQPRFVDLSSGLEEKPGIKSPEKIGDFFRHVRLFR